MCFVSYPCLPGPLATATGIVVFFYLGETEIEDDYDTYRNTLWIDMPWFSRFLHVIKQVRSQVPTTRVGRSERRSNVRFGRLTERAMAKMAFKMILPDYNQDMF